MPRSHNRFLAVGLGLMLSLGPGTRAALAQEGSPDWRGAEKAIGLPGVALLGGVFKIGIPRRDLRVKMGNVEVKPALALGGWLGMMPTAGGEVMGMGDIFLTAPEVPGVVARFLASGIDVTAIHHHLLGERPQFVALHFMAHGSPATIAKKMHDALAPTGTPLTPGPKVSKVAQIPLDAQAIGQVLGATGKAVGGVLQFSVPPAMPVSEGGMVLPPALLNSPLNFQPLGGGRAAIVGDLILLPQQVEPVMAALSHGGITVTALHSHMLDESPRLFFMHFWSTGDAITLARTLRQALDVMDAKQPG